MEQTLAITASPEAVEIEVGGINYKLDTETKEATVIRKSGGWYSGEIVIPAEVEHEGAAYRVVQIGKDAFMDCNGLISVDIPEGVTSIGNYAFQGCSKLTSISLPSTLESIGNYAFQSCSGLTGEIVIPEGVASIGKCAFEFCSKLTSISLPSTLESIGEYAFESCSKLTSISLPSTLESIGEYAFANCAALESITCKAMTAPEIEADTFQGIKANGTLTVPTGATGYDVWMGNSDLNNWTKVESSEL